MTGSNDTRGRPLGESELTARLITAAGDAPGPLSQEEVDRILGVRPGDDDDQA